MVSMETREPRAKFCRVPVRKAWGKKNPLIQNTAGMPFEIQFCKKLIRWTRSDTQEAKGLRDGYAWKKYKKKNFMVAVSHLKKSLNPKPK